MTAHNIIAFRPRPAQASEADAQQAYLEACQLQRIVAARPCFNNISRCADAWRRYCALYAVLEEQDGTT